ncbi:radical activating enzyme [Candidatus Syntrophocurvum alkaliphilum]|uniref:Radical activating enzyme n=1 Tax=Candidatus Syntrophocurvum alkaliphilum TaxID=2293317 RepID=A0A6I6DF31_9FIRM|nr:radical SAM protein [Candidatus Syntrophocurvum alkaliphilum]QGT99602.1 radical activating enzyme [Candidatus Syntrophocurvum alkaliphilum]
MNKVNIPSYLSLFSTGELKERTLKVKEQLKNCKLCPHNCEINRYEEQGVCKAQDKAVIANYAPHFGEEPILVGKNGSGTIFFSYCNMSCVFCQNWDISHKGEGIQVSNNELAQIMIKLQKSYLCHNINLVTPTHFVPQIIEAVLIACENGLNIPIVYNCGGYESVDTLKMLDGIIDIYMPDFKYHSNEMGAKYSKVKNYSESVKDSLREMDRQVGGVKLDNKNIVYQGLLIRHLMLPEGLNNTLKILRFIKNELDSDCLVNIMKQYYPAYKSTQYKELNNMLNTCEYKEAIEYARELGIKLIN